jgi:hypothetical protein
VRDDSTPEATGPKAEGDNASGGQVPDNSVSEVGFGKPPIASQFRKGRSGNPKGRPKQSPNVRNEMRDTFLQPIVIKREGKTKTVSATNAVLQKTFQAALNGDPRAAALVYKLLERYLPDQDTGNHDLSESDNLIVDQALQRLLVRRTHAESETECEGISQANDAPALDRRIALHNALGDQTDAKERDVPAPVGESTVVTLTSLREPKPALHDESQLSRQTYRLGGPRGFVRA